MNDAIVLIARIFLAQVFLLSGIDKLGDGYAATQAYMDSMGVPSALLPLVITLEIGGGLALLTGLLARWAALALALFCVAGAFIFHHNVSDQMQSIMFMKNVAMAGGLLMLYVHGPGKLTISVANA